MSIARDIAAWLKASTTKQGPVELASQAEVDAGADTDKPLVPSTAASRYASKTGSETLTNKTLTSPVVNYPSGAGATEVFTQVLTSDKTFTSNASATTIMTVTGITAGTYAVEVFLIMGKSGGGGINIGLNGVSLTESMAMSQAAENPGGVSSLIASGGSHAHTSLVNDLPGAVSKHAKAVATTGGTSSEYRVRSGQGVSSSTSLTVLAGSWVKLTKVG